MTIAELIDEMIVDCEKAVSLIVKGEYIAWCKIMYEFVQKLALLKSTILQATNSDENSEETQNEKHSL